MSHHTTTTITTTNNHNLAASDQNPKPSTTMDKNSHPKPKPTTSNNHRHRHHHHHHHSDPTSTIQTIAHHFSKLYTNHKKTTSKKSQPQAFLDTQPKPTSANTSTASLTKSFSQRGPHNIRVAKITDPVEEGQEIKREIITSPIDFCNSTNPDRASSDKKLSKKECVWSVEGGECKKLKDGGENRRLSMPSVGGGRRRSFCSSQVELGDFLACNGVKIVSVDMAPFMQIHAVGCARKTCDSLEKFSAKSLALTLKKEFDGVYGPAWHCIVGCSFGSFVTHSTGGFLYFSLDQKLHVLLFKTSVERAADLK